MTYTQTIDEHKASELYDRPNINRVDTQIIKTKNGNYIYRHVISANSRQDARYFNPQTGTDEFCEDRGFFHHLSKHRGVAYWTVEDRCLTGKDVQEFYERDAKFRNL